MTLGSMSIFFALKPRCKDYKYLGGLYLQYFLLSGSICYPSLTSSRYIEIIIIMITLLTLLIFATKVRSAISNLPDPELHIFLTQVVLKEGILIGLSQLSFLIFSSIQCINKLEKEVLYWRQCNRTLYSQTGLGYMVVLYTTIQIISGLALLRILSKYMVSVKKVLSMELSVTEFISNFGIAISLGCAVYLLGSYGAEGDFNDNFDSSILKALKGERKATIIVMTCGCICLVLTAIYKMIYISREMKLESKIRTRLSMLELIMRASVIESENNILLTEASSVWVVIAIFTSTIQVTVCILMTITTKNENLLKLWTLSAFLLP